MRLKEITPPTKGHHLICHAAPSSVLRNTEVCDGNRKRSHSRQSRNGSPRQPESLAAVTDGV
jgi:hypothetical protein